MDRDAEIRLWILVSQLPVACLKIANNRQSVIFVSGFLVNKVHLAFVVVVPHFSFGDNVLLNVGRHDVVVAEFHCIAPHAAGHTRQGSSVSGDFSEGNFTVNGREISTRRITS